MTKPGLYIPMPVHIEMYCRAEDYTSCQHYTRGCELIREAAQQQTHTEELGRRQHKRVAKKHTVSVAQCDEHGRETDTLDPEAVTIDLSRGGMRVELHQAAPVNQKVFFMLLPESSSPAIPGIGEVRWCRGQQTSNKYQAGVAFTDPKTFQTISSYFDLPEM